MSSQTAIPSAVQLSGIHLHVLEDECPSCGQVIPPEKLEEINGKIAAKERERRLAITSSMEAQFAQERRTADEQHRLQLAEWQKSLSDAAAAKKAIEENNEGLKTEILQLVQGKAASVEAARVEGKQAAERVTEAALSALRQTHVEAERAAQERLSTAEAATVAAEAATQEAVNTAVAEKLAEAQRQHNTQNAALSERLSRSEAETVAARAATQTAVSAAVAEKLAEAQKQHQAENVALEDRLVRAEAATAEAQAATQAAVDSAVADKLAEARKDHATSNAALEARLLQAETASNKASAELQKRNLANTEALAAADAKAIEATNKLSEVQTVHAAELAKQLAEQREIFGKAKDEAVNELAAKHFDENRRLNDKVNDLTRDLERKSNEELGEGAEVKLYEVLKAEFPGDDIKEVKRGQPGGDVLHIVLHQGKPCGTIIYDSKNHKRWLTDHAAKLKTDQLAANAEHAVLSTHKFPQGTGQLHIHDGVILANPARVVVVATMLRRHLVQMHTLKVSTVEQDSKKDALYAFITSERSTLLFQRIDAKADALLELQKKETDWHQNHWKKQGTALRDIQKSKADLETEISIIVGTIDQDDQLLSEDIEVCG